MTVSGHRFDPTILREYDIRGVVGRTLTSSDALALGRTMGTIASAGGRRLAVVGYDGRMSSPALEEELARGLARCGLFVLRIGLVPTPCVYFAARMLGAGLGVMVTGSHNPPEYNGFKMVLGGAPFYGEDIQRLRDRAARAVWTDAPGGGIVDVDAASAYVARLAQDHLSHRPLRVAWDAGNGAAGPVTLDLARRLPGEHLLLNETVDGSFPNHHPDPSVAANLDQLRELVLAERLDLGVAFDGDGDRIGVVDDEGEIIWGDQLLAILAREVLASRPGAQVLADVKASQVLFDEIARLGGHPVMCPTGHSIIKTLMAENGAPLAGEMSGHIFMADRYYGYDDALYVAVRLINLVAGADEPLSAMRKALPAVVNTPELRIEVPEERKFAIVREAGERLAAAGAAVSDIDGVRVTTADGWWLLRASNTQNALVARCESQSTAGLARLKRAVADELAASGVAQAAYAELAA